MVQEPYRVGDSAADAQARALADSIDAAAADLRRNGPVPAAELRRALEQLEAEWAGAPGECPVRERTAGRSAR